MLVVLSTLVFPQPRGNEDHEGAKPALDRLPAWMGTLLHTQPESLPLPASQNDSFQSIHWPTDCHLEPLLMVSNMVLYRRQGLTRPCGPLEGTGSPQPLEATLLVLSHEED